MNTQKYLLLNKLPAIRLARPKTTHNKRSAFRFTLQVLIQCTFLGAFQGTFLGALLVVGLGTLAAPTHAQDSTPGASILEKRSANLNLAGIGKAESNGKTTLTIPIVEAETDNYRRLAVSPRILRSQPNLDNAQLQNTSVEVVVLPNGQRAVQITGSEAIAALSAISIELQWVGGAAQKDYLLVPSLPAPELPRMASIPTEKPIQEKPTLDKVPEVVRPAEITVEVLPDIKPPAAATTNSIAEPSALMIARAPITTKQRADNAPYQVIRKKPKVARTFSSDNPNMPLAAKSDVLKLDPPTNKKMRLNETKIAKKAARTEESSRIKELQSQIAQLQLLVDLKNKAIAFNQQKLAESVGIQPGNSASPLPSAASAAAPTVTSNPVPSPTVATGLTPNLPNAANAKARQVPSQPQADSFMQDLPLFIVAGLLLLLLLSAIFIWTRRHKSKDREKARRMAIQPETNTFTSTRY